MTNELSKWWIYTKSSWRHFRKGCLWSKAWKSKDGNYYFNKCAYCGAVRKNPTPESVERMMREYFMEKILRNTNLANYIP